MEFWNFFTHIIGVFIALFLLYKIVHIKLREFVFTICMITCLGFSSAYHFCLFLNNDDQFVRKLDHCGIFLLIAGVSTAIFKNKWAITILWAATLSFIVSLIQNTVLSVERLTTMYLFFGWICTMWAIKERWLSWDILYICLGSAIMTSGSFINLYDYRIGHIIFHVLTLIGSLFYVKLIFRN